MATQPVKKGERIAEYVNALGWPKEGPSPYYLAYFNCFNGQEYYEAHDVLEHLWLRGRDANSAFYQGLIQLAGAFVHLKKQWSRPEHPKDGRRMHPAVRLFRLAEENLSPYRPEHLGLNLEEVFTRRTFPGIRGIPRQPRSCRSRRSGRDLEAPFPDPCRRREIGGGGGFRPDPGAFLPPLR